MLVTLHDRLAPMLDAGKTTDDAVAAKPTKISTRPGPRAFSPAAYSPGSLTMDW